MKSAPATCAIESAAAQSLRSTLTPSFNGVAPRTAATIAAIAATVTGGTSPRKKGESPTFSTIAPSSPARSSFSASDRANATSSSIASSLRGAPGSGGIWIIPRIAPAGKRSPPLISGVLPRRPRFAALCRPLPGEHLTPTYVPVLHDGAGDVQRDHVGILARSSRPPSGLGTRAHVFVCDLDRAPVQLELALRASGIGDRAVQGEAFVAPEIARL